MIRGIGTDLIEIARIQSILISHQAEKFSKRILSPLEMQILPSASSRYWIQFMAGRFAAKEAIAKAIGTGIGAQLKFQEITIVPDTHGKPTVSLHPLAQARCKMDTHSYIHVSITHTPMYAAAFAILEQRSNNQFI